MSIYADVVRYRDLFANLFRRDFQARYKGSALGVLWSLANPLLLVAIYVVVFSVLLRVGGDIPHYALYVLTGLAPWLFFSTSLQMAARSMLDNANLIRKTRFPRQLVPLSSVATQLVTFGVMMVVLLVLNVALIPDVRSTAWLGVLLALLFVPLVGGLAVAVSAANVVFRDVEHLVSAVLLPWFFLTPVLYSFEALPGVDEHETLVEVLRWANPLTPPIEALRAPLWAGEWPAAGDVLYLVVAAAASLALGAWVFTRADDRIATDL
jgi:lipopolysaccharide transport system permease protein